MITTYRKPLPPTFESRTCVSMPGNARVSALCAASLGANKLALALAGEIVVGSGIGEVFMTDLSVLREAMPAAARSRGGRRRRARRARVASTTTPPDPQAWPDAPGNLPSTHGSDPRAVHS